MKRVGIHFAALSGFLMTASSALAEDGGKKMLPALDVALFPGVLFWGTVGFLILLVVIQKFGVPGIEHTIGNRQETLETDLGHAREMSEKAQATVEAYENDLHKARMKANETVSGIVAEAEKEAEAQLASQAKDIKHRLEVAHENVIKAKEDALKEAQPHIAKLVEEVYSEVLQSGLGQKLA